ncbi:MAG: serine hydrolase [candidate division Zixibacteria bacterium]|nr:serine hydrolase [candidate division Zixibacteria bacterium]
MKKLANVDMAALAAATVVIFATAAFGAEPPPVATAPTSVLADRLEVEAFFDGVMAEQLKSYHIPGATVAVVADGELLFAKGYGYADLATHRPVVADRTLFRLASVSKLFTWTAVMQLVEKGKLDLNADVNEYLGDIRIPPAFGKPITLANLMTHTSGFEDMPTGIYVNRAEDLRPLATYLKGYVPARIFPPGEIPAYSNYGTALAGYIVERVAGVPFERYVEENIFEPLRMERSTFREPLPPALEPDVAVGYKFVGGVFEPQNFEWMQQYPAASLSAPATDMAHFMVAHLEGGRYGSSRILGEAAAREMHRRLFTPDPRVNGWAHGFLEMTLNGERVIWHGGDTIHFHTILVLFPEHDVGFFASYNSFDGAFARLDLLYAFADRYFPAARTPAPKPAPGAGRAAARYAGSYIISRRVSTRLLKYLDFLTPPTVKATPDGYLLAPGALARPTSRYLEVEPGTFRRVEADGTLGDKLVFGVDERGRVKCAFFENDPTIALVRVPWYRGASFHRFVLAACLVLFLTAIFTWPVAWLLGRRRERARDPLLARLARFCAWALSFLNVVFVVTVMRFFDPVGILYGLPAALKAAFVVSIVTAVLAVVIVVLAVAAWVKGFWRVPGRVHYTLVAAAAVAFVLWLNYWNLLGFRY